MSLSHSGDAPKADLRLVAGQATGEFEVTESHSLVAIELFQEVRDQLPIIPIVSHRPAGQVIARQPALLVAEFVPQVSVAPSPLDITELVAEAHGVDKDDILAEGRSAQVVRARQLVMALSVELSGLSTVLVGRALKRDHTTVMYGCKRIRDLAERDEAFALQLDNLRQAVESHAYAATGQEEAVLLTDEGLEATRVVLAQDDRYRAMGVEAGMAMYVRPKIAPRPEVQQRLWSQFGLMAHDALRHAARQR